MHLGILSELRALLLTPFFALYQYNAERKLKAEAEAEGLTFSEYKKKYFCVYR